MEFRHTVYEERNASGSRTKRLNDCWNQKYKVIVNPTEIHWHSKKNALNIFIKHDFQENKTQTTHLIFKRHQYSINNISLMLPENKTIKTITQFRFTCYIFIFTHAMCANANQLKNEIPWIWTTIGSIS